MTAMSKKILFLGYGYTARALAALLRADRWTIAGTARSAEKAAAVEADGAEPVLWTEGGIDPRALDGVEALLVSTPPDEEGCPSFRALREQLPAQARALAWIGYLSSNAVYGDHGGAWVDETSNLAPTTKRGFARIAAEAAWASHAAEHSAPFAIFRLPGIYGAGRSALESVREGRAQRIYKEGQVFNRMHVDDIAATLKASIERPLAGELFNLSDDEPSPPQDVIEYACALLGVEPPPLVPLEHAGLSEMGRSFYGDNKRVGNARLKQALGVTLRYPTYREGLDALFREGFARA
ncbi:MAG: SDR family oxidoreductase [Amphiplicatus sp.]